MPAPFAYPAKWFRRMVFKRAGYTTNPQGVVVTDTDDFIRWVDENNNVMAAVSSTGGISISNAIIKRANTIVLAPGDLLQITDETNTILSRIGADGKLTVFSGVDFNQVFGRVECSVLGGNVPFQIWNPTAAMYHFRSYSNSFNIPGTNYSNGSVNMTPINFRGLKTTTGSPSGAGAGTWTTGDVIMDSAKVWWLCTAGGTPGTWV